MWSEETTFAKGFKEVYVAANMAMYQSDEKVDKVLAEIQSLMLKDGWKPYGQVIGSVYFKKNAVKLMVSVNEAAGLGGKSAIQIMGEQMSLDLPVHRCHDSSIRG